MQLMRAVRAPVKDRGFINSNRVSHSADPQFENQGDHQVVYKFRKELPMTKKSNNNAFKHGAYAKNIVLPSESVEEFEQLLQGHRLQYNPTNEPQEAVVRELAGIQWMKDRVNASLRQCFLYSELVVSEIGKSPVDVIVHSIKAAMGCLTSSSMTDMALARVDKILRVASDLLSAAQNPLSHNADALLKLLEQLDRRYDKCVQRLVAMKEYDRLYGAKPTKELPKPEPTPIAADKTAGDTAKSAKLNGANADDQTEDKNTNREGYIL